MRVRQLTVWMAAFIATIPLFLSNTASTSAQPTSNEDFIVVPLLGGALIPLGSPTSTGFALTGDGLISLNELMVQVGKLIDQRRNELQDKIKMTPRSQRPVQSRPYRHTSDGLGTAGGKAVPSAREGSMSDATHQKILCIRVTGQDEAIRALLAKNPTEPHAVRRAEKEVSVELFLPEQVLEQIDRKRLHVQVLYDATARGQERQQDVGKGNRFEGEHRLFEGFGKKTKEEPR